MKQINIFGGVDIIETNHPQFENKKINENYYGSDLNKFVAEKCRKDMVVNNIDLIINDYKNGCIRIIESKHSNEKLQKGQELLLKRLCKIGIKCYVVYGNFPYNDVLLHCLTTDIKKQITNAELISFLNNEHYGRR